MGKARQWSEGLHRVRCPQCGRFMGGFVRAEGRLLCSNCKSVIQLTVSSSQTDLTNLGRL
jgi:transposase-like protein